MYNNGNIIYLKALSPIQVGDSKSISGSIKNIQRDANNLPKIDSTIIKGALKQNYKGNSDLLFGREGSSNYGNLGFMDARFLLLPVRTSENIYEYITSPKVIIDFLKECAGAENQKIIEEITKLKEMILNNKCILVSGKTTSKITILDINFSVEPSKKSIKLLHKILSHVADKKTVYMLNDEDFEEFVNYGIEDVTRVKLNNMKNQNMFHEENIPENTVFYSKVMQTSLMDDVEYNLPKNICLGGGQTLGKGRMKLVKEGES